MGAYLKVTNQIIYRFCLLKIYAEFVRNTSQCVNNIQTKIINNTWTAVCYVQRSHKRWLLDQHYPALNIYQTHHLYILLYFFLSVINRGGNICTSNECLFISFIFTETNCIKSEVCILSANFTTIDRLNKNRTVFFFQNHQLFSKYHVLGMWFFGWIILIVIT